ncbi:uncharacterized protein LOC109610624, partial [Camponotus floridanus]|uniref:uncharacterized protein LOC109610624 n=1 Tax=Camponotus floridanus TaxID=104421 RepID=UPI000DC66C94
NINIVKYLLEQLQMIYNQLTDKNEICIIRKYGKYGKRYTVGLICKITVFVKLIAIFTIPIPLLYPFWLYIFDSPLIINDSRPRFPLPHSTEYFVDQKKYFYWILLHANAALLIEIVAILATGSIFLVCQQYACGMFRIARIACSYRIEQSLVVDILQEGSLQNKNMIYKKLIRAVDMHREAMRFSDSSISRFKVMFSFMITAGVISTSLNLFQISQILSFGYDVKKLLFPLIRVITFMFYMFIANYVAQKIIDHNNVVFATAYNIQWYTTSLNVQKMILFLLQRSTKIFSLNIAGLFEGSLESAAMLLSTEISYFTVLYSTQTCWFRININIVKYLLEQLQKTYSQLTDENEICIIRKYGKYGKRYTVGLILTINDSRPHFPLPHSTEYFVDQKKYFYWILLHANVALLIGIVTILASGTILIVYQQYACGMFRIASYRIEQSVTFDTSQKGSLRNKNLIYKELIRAVNMHREAMRFSDSSISRFKVMFSFMIAVGVISTSLNLFRISQMLSFGYDVTKLLFPLSRVITFMWYMFIGNYVAQEVMDHNNNVFITVYNIRWYTTSLNVQKMILFLLQRSTKIFSLNIAGLFVGSLEGVAMLVYGPISNQNSFAFKYSYSLAF